MAFAVSYDEIATSKSKEWNGSWLYGSIAVVTLASACQYGVLSGKDISSRIASGTAFGLVIGAVYTYALFFVVLNTLGS